MRYGMQSANGNGLKPVSISDLTRKNLLKL